MTLDDLERKNRGFYMEFSATFAWEYFCLATKALAAVEVLYLVSRALDIVLYGALLAVAM